MKDDYVLKVDFAKKTIDYGTKITLGDRTHIYSTIFRINFINKKNGLTTMLDRFKISSYE
jgi:hypothetical protein